MDFFKDEYVKRYALFGLIGVSIFAGLALLFMFMFKQNYDISLSTYTIDFGDDTLITELVDSVGGTPVREENIINANTLMVDDVEIVFDGFDSNVLGSQEVHVRFSNNANEQVIVLKVVDKIPPVIHIDTEQPLSLSLDDVRAKNVGKVFHVTDNQTPDNKIDISTYIDEDNYGYGDNVHLFIEASDLSGNKSTSMIEISIKEKEVPKEKTVSVEKEESGTVEAGSDSSNVPNRNGGYSGNSGNGGSGQYVPNTGGGEQIITVPACSYKAFYESQYGNLINAYNAAISYYNSCSSASVLPINDSDGNTIGWSVS